MNRSKSKVLGMILLLVVLVLGTGLAAWSEITLHPGESGEAQWWYREDPLVGQWVCGSGGFRESWEVRINERSIDCYSGKGGCALLPLHPAFSRIVPSGE